MRRLGAILLCLTACKAARMLEPVGELAAEDTSRTLREGADRPVPDGTPSALIVALDGVDRDLLYEMLRGGELPGLARLLGGDSLRHAHLDRTVLASMPTMTFASWATIFTGVSPAEHGVTGNEYFDRDR